MNDAMTPGEASRRGEALAAEPFEAILPALPFVADFADDANDLEAGSAGFCDMCDFVGRFEFLAELTLAAASGVRRMRFGGPGVRLTSSTSA
jgi:hypothetical protein